LFVTLHSLKGKKRKGKKKKRGKLGGDGHERNYREYQNISIKWNNYFVNKITIDEIMYFPIIRHGLFVFICLGPDFSERQIDMHVRASNQTPISFDALANNITHNPFA